VLKGVRVYRRRVYKGKDIWGNFGQIWADSAASIVAYSMSQLGLKS
jgi:hypothetical protein